MNRFALKNISLVLMLIAFPLISIGTTGDRAALWITGLIALTLGALIPPAMRYLPDEPEQEPRQRPTDLGDSCRVC